MEKLTLGDLEVSRVRRRFSAYWNRSKLGSRFRGYLSRGDSRGKTYFSDVLFTEIPVAGMLPREHSVMAVAAQRELPPNRPRSILGILARADELEQLALTEPSRERTW